MNAVPYATAPRSGQSWSEANPDLVPDARARVAAALKVLEAAPAPDGMTALEYTATLCEWRPVLAAYEKGRAVVQAQAQLRATAATAGARVAELEAEIAAAARTATLAGKAFTPGKRTAELAQARADAAALEAATEQLARHDIAQSMANEAFLSETTWDQVLDSYLVGHCLYAKGVATGESFPNKTKALGEAICAIGFSNNRPGGPNWSTANSAALPDGTRRYITVIMWVVQEADVPGQLGARMRLAV